MDALGGVITKQTCRRSPWLAGHSRRRLSRHVRLVTICATGNAPSVKDSRD